MWSRDLEPPPCFTYTIVYLKQGRSLLQKMYWYLQYFCWSSWSSTTWVGNYSKNCIGIYNTFLGVAGVAPPGLVTTPKIYWYLQNFDWSSWSSTASSTPPPLHLYSTYSCRGRYHFSCLKFLPPALSPGPFSLVTPCLVARCRAPIESCSPCCGNWQNACFSSYMNVFTHVHPC